jgi:hypothetical protein
MSLLRPTWPVEACLPIEMWYPPVLPQGLLVTASLS